ncbi:hypothetical protein OBRU01_18896 [Operophtera brumata]|uniref:CDGSH iron-sulfur domain-containing protein 2 homologue n=1 Tax=Operophtera brumata TaxID=104452 RepID=A0A0L7KY27_OPEBR|nr:hypothetical protein OBRU01_18896 [Operophtera brumata]
MHTVSNLVKVTIPSYLESLPIPDTLGGWFRLGVKDWLALIPPTLVIGGVSYYSYYSYQVIKKVRNGMAPINPSIRKDQPKVVDVIDIEDINGKQAFCRCWKSANWPICDGTHATHNMLSGDNTGPVVVKFRESK